MKTEQDNFEVRIIDWYYEDINLLTENHFTNENVLSFFSRRIDQGRQELISDKRIYAYKIRDKFIVMIYTSEEEYDMYTMVNIGEVIGFLDSLMYNHPEYNPRPIRIVDGLRTLLVPKQ